MTEPSYNSAGAFIQIAGKKIESLDNKIEAIEAEMASIPACTAAVNKLIAVVETREPNNEALETLSNNLANCMQLLKQPQLLVTRHEHKLSTKIWITAAVFLILCLAFTGWYNTANKLDNYIANDTKWRYLKLDTARKSFQIYLLSIDSFYNSRVDLRKTVLAQEEQNRLNFERLQEAAQLKAQAKELEIKAKRKQETISAKVFHF